MFNIKLYIQRIIKSKENVNKYEDTCYFTNHNFIELMLNNLSLNKKYNLSKKIRVYPDRQLHIIKMKKTKEKFILKIIDNDKMMQKEDLLYFLENNTNPFILKYHEYGIYEHNKNCYFYMIYTYFEGTTLANHLSYNKNFREDELKYIFHKIIKLVKYLHDNNVVHSDLKLENLLINEKKDIIVIDFDLSFICYNSDGIVFDGSFGTLKYIAPESYDVHVYSKKSDIWQIGVILFILITFDYPIDIGEEFNLDFYNNSCNFYGYNKFKTIRMDLLTQNVEKKKYSKEWIDIVHQMLMFNDKERLDIQDIMLLFEKKLMI